MIRPAAALFSVLLLAAPARAQALAVSPECGQMRDRVAAVICATPALAAADGAVAFALKGLQRELPADRRAALARDQQAWVRARAASCGDKAAVPLRRCLFAETQARRRMLAGGGGNRERGARRVDPAFFYEARGGRYEIAIAYPEIVGATTAADLAFNKAAHDLIIGDVALMGQYRTPDPAGSGATSNSVFYDIHYLGPRLASVIYWLVSASRRWRRPFMARETLVFDLRQGRALRPDNILAAPGRSVGRLSALCRRDLEARARQQGWKPSPAADVAAVIANFRNWAPGPFALDILFDPGSIAAEAAGPQTCRLDYRVLLPLLKLDGPLPPR